MAVAKQVFKVVLLSVLLLSIVLVFRQPHTAFYNASDAYVFSAGSAVDPARSEILEQLFRFQDGYTRRDLDKLDSFMERLFSQENAMILGTMPDEIYIGYKDVSRLIYSDWNAWGDCTFFMQNAHISTSGNAAWISTIGYVKFDVPRFLVLPLRLSAVMVKEELGWKFQFIQFQFDLNFITLFLTALIVSAWLLVSLISLIAIVTKRLLLKIRPA